MCAHLGNKVLSGQPSTERETSKMKWHVIGLYSHLSTRSQREIQSPLLSHLGHFSFQNVVLDLGSSSCRLLRLRGGATRKRYFCPRGFRLSPPRPNLSCNVYSAEDCSFYLLYYICCNHNNHHLCAINTILNSLFHNH